MGVLNKSRLFCGASRDLLAGLSWPGTSLGPAREGWWSTQQTSRTGYSDRDSRPPSSSHFGKITRRNASPPPSQPGGFIFPDRMYPTPPHPPHSARKGRPLPSCISWLVRFLPANIGQFQEEQTEHILSSVWISKLTYGNVLILLFKWGKQVYILLTHSFLF